MENNTWKKSLKFHGSHGELVGLRILNNVLKTITLGFYYPWAKVKELKYMYNETEYMNSRFVFHGTGKEVFIGFIKALLIFGSLNAFLFYCLLNKNESLAYVGLIVFYLGFFALIPLAIHGSLRYRLSRTSWRGIHFGYRGNLKEFYGIYIKNIILTILTFGIYSSWMRVAMNKYIREKIRFGSIQFSFEGKGVDLFIINLKGIIFSILTFGIYSFWFYKNRLMFEVNNTKIIQDGKEINLRSTLTPSEIFKSLVVNYLIVAFTFGIGTGIAINRIARVLFQNIEFEGEIDADAILQTEEEYKDASGDDMVGMLDISII
jgi:uncharacterized membrane protein YjgN (DUF898 family)